MPVYIKMLDVLYITSSSFSGSTLLSFLLNSHPAMTSAGEMEGWNPSSGGDFPCSCGEPVQSCPFFTGIGELINQSGLNFGETYFGTGYRIVNPIRLNRYLTSAFPGGVAPWLENFRDNIILHTPPFSQRIRAIDKANILFIKYALEYANAKVFVDAQKDCYRINFLTRIPELNVKLLYLIRDMKGVVASNMRIKKWPVKLAINKWLQEQDKITRIFNRHKGGIIVDYDSLCEAPVEELNKIYRFSGVEPIRQFDDFRKTEHHILGNSMRLENIGTISKSMRWKSELTQDDLSVIYSVAEKFIQRYPQHLITPYIKQYLEPQNI